MKGLYVHVPFCDHICAYCDFMRCAYSETLADQWLKAVSRELEMRHIDDCKTVYIGGGTPSSLSCRQLQQLLTLLKPYLASCKEATVEVNAESLTDDKLKVCRDYGINRISMGAQSFQKELLSIIDRKADYEMIRDAVMRIHKHGIHDISLDLMYGLPHQTMQQWQDDLNSAVQLAITHLSLYALTIEEHSRFGREKVKPCDPDTEADFFESAIAYLKQNGFEHYEISNFARNGHYAEHNLLYWHYEDFYGIGCGASGKLSHMRYDNTRNLHTYITEGVCEKKHLLTKQDEMFETVMMGLRLKDGINKQVFYRRYQCELTAVYKEAIHKHKQLGNLIETKESVYASYQGMMILHDILVDFL